MNSVLNRRQFLQTTAAGLALPFWNGWVMPARGASGTDDLALLEARREGMVFPQPGRGRTVDLTPPGFVWFPAPEGKAYFLRVRTSKGRVIYETRTGSDPVHRPSEVFPPGSYEWNVRAIGEDGTEGPWRGWQSFVIAEGAPELPWVEPAKLLARMPDTHPRVIYTPADVERIRERVQRKAYDAWRDLKNAADRHLDTDAPEPPKYDEIEDDGKRRIAYVEYFQYLREYDSRLEKLSLVYLITKNPKYAEAAKRILMEWTTWSTADDAVTSVRRSYDEPGLSIARVAHLAYDWLYDSFSESERTAVRQMVAERTRQSLRRLRKDHNYLTYSGSSHPARLIAYLVEQATALAGDVEEGPTEWLDYALKGLTTFYPHWGGSDGGWAEGIPYGLWYNFKYIPGFETLRRTADYNLWKQPFFRKLRWFYFYCTSIRGEMRPFGDSAEGGGPGEAPNTFGSLMSFHAHRYDDPYVSWWVQKLEGYDGSTNKNWSLLHLDPLPEPKAPTDLPQSRAFHGVGWAGLHSNLAEPDRDTFMVFKSSPYGSVSHSHADQNSFAIMKGGHALAIPSGYYGPSYGRPHHAEWTRSTKANNCVLVNGEGQVVRDHEATGRLAAFEEQPGFTYLCGDAAAAYRGKLEQFDRHILFLRPNLFVLLDVLEAPQASRFQWMLHALEPMQLNEDRTRVITRRNERWLDVRLRSPGGLSLSHTDEFGTPYDAGMPADFDETVPPHYHLTAETQSQHKATRIGAVMMTGEPGETSDLNLIEHDGWLGARTGDVEGWVQLQRDARGPANYGDTVRQGRAILCGRDRDGQRFVR